MPFTVRIPAGTCGLSEPFRMNGYRVASINVPRGWLAGDISFRGAARSDALVATQVVPTGVVAGLGPDAVAADIQMANAVRLQRGREFFDSELVDPIDVSALLSPAATIDVNDHGILWVFQRISGRRQTAAVALQVDKDASDYTSAIAAWAQFSKSTRLMPDPGLYVPIGAVHVNEGGSGAFAWGTDSIAAETEAYHNFAGLPEMLVPLASLALDAGAATFTYGAGTARLGTGLRVALSGKVNVTIAGSNVADGAVGAWLLYALADDVEYALQLGNAYASLNTAQKAVASHRRNPMLALMGAMYVQNGSGGAFIPGTTNLDAAGITTTFETFGPRLKNVFDDNDVEVIVQAAADRHIILSGGTKELLTRSEVLQIRSGTSATPVNQTASPDLELILEAV